MACRADQIPAGCTSNRMGCRLRHLAENIYELYCCVQILTISAADFIGQTATSDSDQLRHATWSKFISKRAGWRFTAHCHGKSQSFEISLTLENFNSASTKLYAWFTFLTQALVETFGEMWTTRRKHECKHSHSRASIINNEVRHSRHSRFLWLGTDLPTCLWKFQDETRTGQECRRQDECALHTLIFILSRTVSARM